MCETRLRMIVKERNTQSVRHSDLKKERKRKTDRQTERDRDRKKERKTEKS